MEKHQVGVAAESQAAAIFAQGGYSVFVQYGANQPGYDLIVSNDTKTIHVSVKGSQTGGWILTAKKRGGSYDQALQDWEQKNGRYVFLFVQYRDIAFGEMPRIYLARGSDVAKHLRTAAWGKINLSLIEKTVPKRGPNKGKPQEVPQSWKLSPQRIRELFGIVDAHE